MIEAVMLWNEPNNRSHWDTQLDPDWSASLCDEWVGVVYEGPEMFVHAQAGVFVRGTRTRLRREVAAELAARNGFRLAG